MAISLPVHFASFPDPLARTLDPRLFQHFDPASQVFSQPDGERITAKALLGPHQFQSRKILLCRWLQEAFGSFPIPHIGSQDDDRQ